VSRAYPVPQPDRRCAAAHAEDVSACEGPLDAVRVVDELGGEVLGCVRHGAVLLASLECGRVYPGPGHDGYAIEVFKRAQQLKPFNFRGPTVPTVVDFDTTAREVAASLLALLGEDRPDA
jgi:hypothetical protein